MQDISSTLLLFLSGWPFLSVWQHRNFVHPFSFLSLSFRISNFSIFYTVWWTWIYFSMELSYIVCYTVYYSHQQQCADPVAMIKCFIVKKTKLASVNNRGFSSLHTIDPFYRIRVKNLWSPVSKIFNSIIHLVNWQQVEPFSPCSRRASMFSKMNYLRLSGSLIRFVKGCKCFCPFIDQRSIGRRSR